METKKRTTHLAEGQIRGTWQLKYKLTGHLGVQGFSGRMIGPYSHPVTQEVCQLILPGSPKPELGFFISDVIMNFSPEKSRRDAAIVDWLVGHPEVGILNNQTKLERRYLDRKRSNPRITIVNLDHQDMEDIENEEFIDQIVGQLSLDSGQKAVGLDKLRFILAKLGLNYRNAKFISDPKVEKLHLRKTLKTFIRKDIDNAKTVEKILDNMANAKYVYEIKELMRLKIITLQGGMYLYEGNPLGTSYESIIDFFNKNEEFYADVVKKLYDIQKSEIYQA